MATTIFVNRHISGAHFDRVHDRRWPTVAGDDSPSGIDLNLALTNDCFPGPNPSGQRKVHSLRFQPATFTCLPCFVFCDAVLAARKAKAHNYQQEHIASKIEIIVRGLARVGIIAGALARILEAFIAKECGGSLPYYMWGTSPGGVRP